MNVFGITLPKYLTAAESVNCKGFIITARKMIDGKQRCLGVRTVHNSREVKEAITYLYSNMDKALRVPSVQESESESLPLSFDPTDEAQDEPQSEWGKDSRPAKETSRVLLLENCKNYMIRPFRRAFELSSPEYKFTERLKDLCEGTDDAQKYGRIFSAEHKFFKEAQINNPGINQINGKASYALKLLAEDGSLMDFIWGDFCGGYCHEMEMFIENSFKTISHNGLFYLTLCDIRQNEDYDAVKRLLNSASFLDVEISDESELYKFIPFFMMFAGTFSGHFSEPIFYHTYRNPEGNIPVHLFGFLIQQFKDPKAALDTVRLYLRKLGDKSILKEVQV